MAATAATLARAPLAPNWPRDAARVPVVPTADAAGAVTLTWNATAGDAIDHFVIAARATTENFYRQRVTVGGNATSRTVTPAELGLTIGQAFLISVAAVDAKGHESLFGYPEFRCEGSSCALPAGALNVTAAR
jgi:hypothetical protein